MELMSVPDQVRTMSHIGTSSYIAYPNMAQKVPTWSNSQFE